MSDLVSSEQLAKVLSRAHYVVVRKIKTMQKQKKITIQKSIQVSTGAAGKKKTVHYLSGEDANAFLKSSKVNTSGSVSARKHYSDNGNFNGFFDSIDMDNKNNKEIDIEYAKKLEPITTKQALWIFGSGAHLAYCLKIKVEEVEGFGELIPLEHLGEAHRILEKDAL